MASERQQQIASVIAAELARQGVSGVDTDAVAQVVEAALGGPIEGAVAEGPTPDELNSSNDG